jgi:hypothetical protein
MRPCASHTRLLRLVYTQNGRCAPPPPRRPPPIFFIAFSEINDICIEKICENPNLGKIKRYNKAALDKDRVNKASLFDTECQEDCFLTLISVKGDKNKRTQT